MDNNIYSPFLTSKNSRCGSCILTERVPKKARYLIEITPDHLKITGIAIKMRMTTFFFSETIDTIVNSLYHIIEKTSSSCLPPSRWRTRRNPRKTGILDFLKITEYNCYREERADLCHVTSWNKSAPDREK